MKRISWCSWWDKPSADVTEHEMFDMCADEYGLYCDSCPYDTDKEVPDDEE